MIKRAQRVVSSYKIMITDDKSKATQKKIVSKATRKKIVVFKMIMTTTKS